MQLDQWQEDFLECKGDKILCTGRQVGKTEICAIDCARYVQKPDNPHPVLMTAPTERQAFLLFDKTLRYLMDNYPKSVILRGVKRPTKTKIELRNGMKIWCLPTGQYGLGIRGITVGRSYEDENSRVAPEIESAIAPMLLTTGGARIKLSTPAGAQGEFWRTWVNKDDAYKSYTRFSVNTEEVVRNRTVCESWNEIQREGALRLIEQAKARMSKREYNQEFMGIFVTDLFRWFSDDIIAQTAVLKRPELSDTKIKHMDLFLGVDIGRMGEDYSSFQIIDRTNRDRLIQIESMVTSKTRLTDTTKKIIYLNDKYDFRHIYVDDGGIGVGVFDALLDHDTTKNKVIAINNKARPLDNEDRQKKKILKEDLYNNLLALMEQNKIRLLDDEAIIQSLRCIQYEYLMKEGEPTRLRIFGTPHNASDIVEGINRAAWCNRDKRLNIWCV